MCPSQTDQQQLPQLKRRPTAAAGAGTGGPVAVSTGVMGLTQPPGVGSPLLLERVKTIPLRKKRQPEERGIETRWRMFAVALVYVTAVLAFVAHRHYKLPRPLAEPFDAKGRPQFSEANAREIIKYLADDLGARVVGTPEEHLARDYILHRLREYETLARKNAAIAEFEIDVQNGSGGHRFDFMDKVVWKRYVNVTNIVVRICGIRCGNDAVLLNSHYDSGLTSTGAADDGAGVAVMLEIIRIMVQSDLPLKNAAIFLFNGAEETLQDASHLFTTQHKWSKEVRAVVNLEACGTTGKEIVFQANSADVIQAYASVPRPHANVIANDVFRTGIILGDTDFRMFVEYGDLTGLDMALYTNSYYYHTMKDVVDEIQQGTLQHMGENTLVLLGHLTVNATLDNIAPADDIVFYDVLGYVFISYSWPTLLMLHGSALVVAPLITGCGEIAPRITWGSRVTFMWALLHHLAVVCTSITSLLAAVVVPNVITLAVPSMVWYRREWLAFVIYVPWAIFGMLSVQYIFRRYAPACKMAPRVRIDSDTDPEHATWHSMLSLMTIILGIMTFYKIPSSYIFFNYTTATICGLIVDWHLRGKHDRSRRGHAPYLAYIVAWTPVAVVTGDLAIICLDMFAPLGGRLGAKAPVDNIIATATGVLTFFISFLFIPYAHRFGETGVRRLATGFCLLGVAAVLCVSTVYPYDQEHPQRVFVQNQRNITSGEIYVYVAHADRGPVYDPMISSLERVFGKRAERRLAADNREDWRSLYPFNQFLDTYRIDVKEYLNLGNESLKSALGNVPTVQAHNSTYDSTDMTRSLSIAYHYPSSMWAVITFDAHVIDWSLSDSKPPFDRPMHYVLREAGGHGVDGGLLSVKIRVSSPEDKLRVELAVLDGEGFGRRGPAEKSIGSQEAGVLARAREATPPWAAASYFGATVGAWEV